MINVHLTPDVAPPDVTDTPVAVMTISFPVTTKHIVYQVKNNIFNQKH